jgi:hypothetical protein
MNYSIFYPTCVKCSTVVDIWNNRLVSDAYQKNGVNRYEFTCPECDEKQVFSIPVEDYEKPVVSYRNVLGKFWNNMFPKEV